jgi:hypothetical protein
MSESCRLSAKFLISTLIQQSKVAEKDVRLLSLYSLMTHIPHLCFLQFEEPVVSVCFDFLGFIFCQLGK